MSDRQCMKEIVKKITIKGEGKSKEEAYGNIFNILRKKVYDDIPGLIVYMEPINVYEVSVESETFTEKFLGLFMPREKTNFKIEANIEVVIRYIEC